MGIISYDYVHSGHVDVGLQHTNRRGPRVFQHGHFGGEKLELASEDTRSWPAEYAQNSMHSQRIKTRSGHVENADLFTTHSSVHPPARLPISPHAITAEQSDGIPTRDIKLGVKKSQIARNDPERAPPHVTLPERPQPESLTLNLASESEATLHIEPDSKIHYRPPQIPSMETSSAVAAVDWTPLPDENLKRVLKLRYRVKMLRLQVQSHRALVQSKQEEKSAADDRYIKQVRTRHVTEPLLVSTDESELKVLEDLWRQCQVARDEYGPIELELTEMEDRLDFEEEKLGRAEEKFYEQLHEVDSSILASEQDHDTESHTSSANSSKTSQAEHEPIYEDYLGRLGDHDILRERLEALYTEKAALQKEQERRRRVQVTLGVDDLEFLASFADMAESTRRELQEVTDDVERLRQKCIEQGILDPLEPSPLGVYAHEIATPAPQPLSGTMSEVETRSELALATSKLPQQQISAENDDVGSRILANYLGYGNFIDTWLLDKLRSSTIEILQLAAYVATRLKVMDTLNWQAESLRLWYSDGLESNFYMDEAVKGNTSR